MSTRQLFAVTLAVLTAACGTARSSIPPIPGMNGQTLAGTECQPSWTMNIPRDSESFYFADLGTGPSREVAMDRAWERTAAELVRRVSAIATENSEYVKRHGSRAATDSTVRTIISHQAASGAELIARSRICDIPEGFSIWQLRRISARLLFRRLAEADPLAVDIDFGSEIRNALRRP